MRNGKSNSTEYIQLPKTLLFCLAILRPAISCPAILMVHHLQRFAAPVITPFTRGSIHKANVKQTHSKHVYRTCALSLLHVFASSCKRGIRVVYILRWEMRLWGVRWMWWSHGWSGWSRWCWRRHVENLAGSTRSSPVGVTTRTNESRHLSSHLWPMFKFLV